MIYGPYKRQGGIQKVSKGPKRTFHNYNARQNKSGVRLWVMLGSCVVVLTMLCFKIFL